MSFTHLRTGDPVGVESTSSNESPYLRFTTHVSTIQGERMKVDGPLEVHFSRRTGRSLDGHFQLVDVRDRPHY